MSSFCSYNVPVASYTYKNVHYRAIADGADYSKGDVICQIMQISEATMQPTGLSLWYNVSTVSTIATPAPADLTSVSGYRVVLSSQTLALNTQTAQALTVPAGANYAEISVLDNDIILRVDGVTPTITPVPIGVRQSDGCNFTLSSEDELNNLMVRELANGQDARIFVTYYCVFGSLGV